MSFITTQCKYEMFDVWIRVSNWYFKLGLGFKVSFHNRVKILNWGFETRRRVSKYGVKLRLRFHCRLSK